MGFKEHFIIPEGMIYMNTPGNGLIPKKIREWRVERDQTFFDPRVTLREEQTPFIQGVRESLATFFNTTEKHVYCTPNFSFGFNVLLDGLPKHLKFLLIAGDYPSLNYPIISRGFAYDTVELSITLEEDIWQQVEQQKPDVLAISIIQYISGVKIDLSFIKKLKEAFPDLLILGDGTQYFGTEPFSFPASGFDAIGGSGYKWLMAGFGNGYTILNEKMQALIYQEAQQKQRPEEAMWSSKTILHTYFEPGHQDTLSHGTLQQSLHFLTEQGLSRVQQQLQETTSYAYEKFQEHNLLLPIAAQRATQSSLINVQIDPNHFGALMAQQVRCFPRGTGIRIGLHLYNDKQDIDQLLAIIDKI